MSLPFVIAEAGVNHNGDLGRALEMVDAAAAAGADCVKFQAFEADKLIAAGTGVAAYQARNTGASDQRDMIRALELSAADFARLADRCRDRGVEFLCTAFDEDMVERLVAMGMRRIKVASGELTNHPALRRFARLGLPVIVSTGMARDDEVDAAIAVLREAGAVDITVLQCTSVYPAPVEAANLIAMVAMGRRNGVPNGYSDHTLGDHAAIAATALGATVIEKHFTLDRNLHGPDHKASLEPNELAAMIRRCRETVAALGEPVKTPTPEELATAALVRRSWHAARDLAAGETLAPADIVLKRPATGIAATRSIAGARLARPVAADRPITEADLAN